MSLTPQELLNRINTYRKAIAETKQSVARDQGQLLAERTSLAQLLNIPAGRSIDEVEPTAKAQYTLNQEQIQRLEAETLALATQIEEEFPL